MEEIHKPGDIDLLPNREKTISTVTHDCKGSALRILKADKKRGTYILRTSIHKAVRQHFCCCCMQYIQPGQKYEKTVRAISQGIMELKVHIDPSCDFPDDPIERYGTGYQEDGEKIPIQNVA